MTFTSVGQSNSKTAEFARLFDLFDRVATRRTRALSGDTRDAISADDIANVPAEFAPVLKNLSAILSLRAHRDEEHVRPVRSASTSTSTTMPRPRHDTLVSTPSTTRTIIHPTPRAEATEQDIESPAFPLGERYPFTFKLMLHRLYDMDEWAEKVKDAVETSKSQFKPLAERVQNVAGDAVASAAKGGGEKRSGTRPVLGASAKFKPPSTARQSHPGAATREAPASVKERGEKKISARPVLGASAKFKPPSTMKHPHSASTPPKPEAGRVVKKRCIGRRKSVNGPISTGVWVYDAAISATEVAGPRPTMEITLSTAKGAGGAAENRARHQSLPQETRARGTARRKIKITVPLLQEEVVRSESVPPQPSLASHKILEAESAVKRKRSVASVFASEACKRVAAKRPLCL